MSLFSGRDDQSSLFGTGDEGTTDKPGATSSDSVSQPIGVEQDAPGTAPHSWPTNAGPQYAAPQYSTPQYSTPPYGSTMTPAAAPPGQGSQNPPGTPIPYDQYAYNQNPYNPNPAASQPSYRAAPRQPYQVQQPGQPGGMPYRVNLQPSASQGRNLQNPTVLIILAAAGLLFPFLAIVSLIASIVALPKSRTLTRSGMGVDPRIIVAIVVSVLALVLGIVQWMTFVPLGR